MTKKLSASASTLLIVLVTLVGCKQAKAPEEQTTVVKQVELSPSDLTDKSQQELRLMRNAIFARHGYKFKSQDLHQHFSKFPWYKPQYDDVTDMLTEIEKQNITTIKALENKLKQSDIAKKESTSPSAKTAIDHAFTLHEDYVIVPAFEVKLELSDKAEEKLRSTNETVIVDAFFSGIPKDKTSKQYQEWGEVSIGQHSIELDTQRIAVFDNVKIERDKFELLDSKNFQILVNVYSGRRSSELNLLSVDIIQDSVDVVMGKQHVLKGKLIGE